MKKRFLTFVISCLLLAAFIGSAEAKKIDTTYNAGAGLIQLAADPGTRMLAGGIDTEWALGEPDDSMKWLLALYRIKDVRDFIALENSANSTDEALPTNEGYEESFSLGNGLFGYNLAGLVYGDSHLNQAADTQVATDQPTVAGSSYEKVPVIRYETIPVKYFDPPTIVYTYTPTPPKKNKLGPVKPPVFPPKKPPKAVPPSEDFIPPEIVIPRKNPPIFAGSPPFSEKPGNNSSKLNPGKFEIPDNSTINSPAPVPEPATMLLFSTGIAGLVFSSLRRNKNADEKKKG